MKNTDFFEIKEDIKDVSFKEKGSKFIGFALKINSVNEVKTVISKIKKEHPMARHHCYAYKISDKNLYRANDDGEPSGTAGLPIYNQILSHDISNIILVVVRYFGGTKLGVSGLIKAYKNSAKITLKQAVLIKKTKTKDLELEFDYTKLGAISREINRHKLVIKSNDMTDICKMILEIKQDDFDRIEKILLEKIKI